MRLYRYETSSFQDEWQEPDSFIVVRKTKCYYVIDLWGVDKFVSKTAKRPFAHLTEEQAKAHFIHRKKWELTFLNKRINNVNRALRKCGFPYAEKPVKLLTDTEDLG